MMRAALVIVVLLTACSQPRYQTSSGPGQTTTRIDTQTGKTEVLVRGADGKPTWKQVQEPTPTASPSARPNTDCASSTLSPKTRQILGLPPCP